MKVLWKWIYPPAPGGLCPPDPLLYVFWNPLFNFLDPPLTIETFCGSNQTRQLVIKLVLKRGVQLSLYYIFTPCQVLWTQTGGTQTHRHLKTCICTLQLQFSLVYNIFYLCRVATGSECNMIWTYFVHIEICSVLVLQHAFTWTFSHNAMQA